MDRTTVNSIAIIILGIAFIISQLTTFQRTQDLSNRINKCEEAITIEKDSIKALFDIIKLRHEKTNLGG